MRVHPSQNPHNRPQSLTPHAEVPCSYRDLSGPVPPVWSGPPETEAVASADQAERRASCAEPRTFMRQQSGLAPTCANAEIRSRPDMKVLAPANPDLLGRYCFSFHIRNFARRPYLSPNSHDHSSSAYVRLRPFCERYGGGLRTCPYLC